jgi:hypothetical protein
METALLAFALLACPLGMLAMGGIGWLWAKRSRDAKRGTDQSTGSGRNVRANERVIG